MRFLVSSRSHTIGSEDPGPTRYMQWSDIEAFHSVDLDEWRDAVLDEEGRLGVLIHVHGFNLKQEEVIPRHEKFETYLRAAGFRGSFVTFDWPAAGRASAYSEDRARVGDVAPRLFTDVIAKLREAKPNLPISIIAHSMGAYLTVSAYRLAAEAGLIDPELHRVDAVMLFAADVSREWMGRNHPHSRDVFAHADRLVNYFSAADSVLSLSNIQKQVLSESNEPEERLGRMGLPILDRGGADVTCAERFGILLKRGGKAIRQALVSHSWYYADTAFVRDVVGVWRGLSAERLTNQTRVPAVYQGMQEPIFDLLRDSGRPLPPRDIKTSLVPIPRPDQ